MKGKSCNSYVTDEEIRCWKDWLRVTQWKWKLLKSCLTLCDPMDCIVPGILQARKLEWVAFSFSRGSSQPRDWTQVSCIAGGFFTSSATREAREYWSGEPIPSPADLPDPGIEPGSPALQVDSSPTELWEESHRTPVKAEIELSVLRLSLVPIHICMYQTVKNLPAMQENWVWSLSREDPLEKGMATRSSILAWKIPWTEELAGSKGSPWFRHDWVTNTYISTYIYVDMCFPCGARGKESACQCRRQKRHEVSSSAGEILWRRA